MYSFFLIAYLVFIFATALLSAYLAWYAWQDPKILGARFLSLVLATVFEINVCFLGLSFATDNETGYFWARLRFLGLAFSSYFFFLFVQEYSLWQIPKAILMLLGLPSIVTQIVVWTTLDRFFFVNWRLVDLGILKIDLHEFTGWFNVHNFIGQVLLITAFLRLLYYAFRVESGKRNTAWLLVFGVATAFILALPISNRPEWQIPKLTPIGVGIMGISAAFAFFRYDFLGLVPIAYDLVVHNIRAAIFVLNPKKQVLKINPYTEDLLRAKSHNFVKMPIELLFQQYFEQAFPEGLEEWGFQKGDKHYEASLAPLKRGTLHLGYLLMIRDISVYKEAESKTIQLKLEQERVTLLSEFINYTSHDLKTPLATIKSSLYLLQKATDDERRNKAAERISEQVAQIDKILVQFHNFIQLDAGYPKQSIKISVQALLNRKAEKYQAILRKYHIRLHYEPPNAGLFVTADIDYLRQAVQALLDNAILYNRPQGEIWLKADAIGTYVHIIVEDTGIGIETEKLSQIFQSLYKGNEARTISGSGAGLGLPLVKRVAGLYGGDILIESALAKGTKASFVLPLSPE